MKKDVVIPKSDYDFKQTSFDEFELVCTMEPSPGMMTVVLSQAHKALRAKGHRVPKQGELSELFDKHVLPEQYNLLVHTSCKPLLKLIYQDLSIDGLVILREEVTKVLYHKQENKWFLTIHFKGLFNKN